MDESNEIKVGKISMLIISQGNFVVFHSIFSKFRHNVKLPNPELRIKPLRMKFWLIHYLNICSEESDF